MIIREEYIKHIIDYAYNKRLIFIIFNDFEIVLSQWCSSGDGNVSFEEFVEIVSNIGANTAAPSDQDQEEQELRDAFRVSIISAIYHRSFHLTLWIAGCFCLRLSTQLLDKF